MRSHDALFRYVVRGVLRTEPGRASNSELLEALRERGVFLIDLLEEPLTGQRLAPAVAPLISRIRSIGPDKIVLIKATVYDIAYQPLVEAGLTVVPERIPFPGNGNQRRFETTFNRAMRSAALD